MNPKAEAKLAPVPEHIVPLDESKLDPAVALASLDDPDAGVALRELAASFREIADGGPATVRLAQRILAEVAAFARSSRGRR